MNNPLTILGIPGSLRKNSYNRAALRAAQNLVLEGVKIEIFELEGIPPFNQDQDQHPPVEEPNRDVARFRVVEPRVLKREARSANTFGASRKSRFRCRRVPSRFAGSKVILMPSHKNYVATIMRAVKLFRG